MNDKVGFDLVNEPWVLTRAGGKVRERSLLDVFAQAHRIDGLAGEVSTQETAVLRLLLVILRRSLPYAARKKDAQSQWVKIWEAESLPVEAISAYLDEHRDRLDLLSPTAPFMQVGDLDSKGTSGLVRLIADVPSGHAYFTTRSGTSLTDLRPAEAARWVVHCQAFDPSGIKTGALGDERVKGGKGYPIGTGWAGRCGVVVVEGSTLKDTLLLNLPLDAEDPADAPVWERPPLTSAVEAGHAHPRGPCDLMTWPIRRIRLIGDREGITDVIISNGDPVQHFNQHRIEPMSAWRRSPAQEKKNGVPLAYMPQEASSDRAMWRGLDGLLVDRGQSAGGGASDRLPPHTIEWLAELQGEGHLDWDYPSRLRTVGMEYGAQNSTTAATVDDALRLRLSVLTDARLERLVSDTLNDAEAAIKTLAVLAGNLAEARGMETDDARAEARRRGYVELDRAYRFWIGSLTTESDLERKHVDWQTYVNVAIRRLGGQLVAEAGDEALRGSLRRGGVDSGKAQMWFEKALVKRLSLAHPKKVAKTEEVAHA